VRLEHLPRTEPPLGALFGGTVALALAAGAVWLRCGLPRPTCLVHSATGWPCPACGATRAFEALAAGRVVEALAWNPLLAAAGLLLAGWALGSLLTRAARRPLRLVPSRGEALALRVLVLVSVAANWAWLVVRGA
jgi:hypothetical protein